LIDGDVFAFSAEVLLMLIWQNIDIR